MNVTNPFSHAAMLGPQITHCLHNTYKGIINMENFYIADNKNARQKCAGTTCTNDHFSDVVVLSLPAGFVISRFTTNPLH